MEINNIEGRSRGSSVRRRALVLVGASALTLSGVGAALFGASQAFANTNIASNPYSIGTVVSGGLSFSASNTAESATGVAYTFGFTVPSGESGTTVTLSGLPGTTSATSAIVTAGGVTTSNTYNNGTGVVSGLSLTAGESVSIVIDGFSNATSLASNPYTVTAAVGTSTAATASFSLTAGASGPAVSLSPTTPSYQGSTLTFSGYTGLSGNTIYLETSGGTTFSAASPVSDYTVTYTTAGSTVQNTAVIQTAVVSALAGTADTMETLTLGNLLSSSDTVTAVAAGASNGATATTFYGNVQSGATPTAAPTSANQSFSIGQALGAVSLTVSPNTAGASNAVYGVSFTVPSGAGANPVLNTTFKDNNGVNVPVGTGYAVFDTTNPAVNSSSTATGTTVPLTGVVAGDSVTVDYYAVHNSTNSSVTASAHLSTTYTIPVQSNSVSMSAASASSSAVNVAVSNTTPSGTATYSISGLVAGGTGVNSAGGTIILDFSTGTTTSNAQTGLGLPTNAVNYTLTDLTNSSSSGLSTVSASASAVTLTTANAITAGDHLQITITGVQNPSSAASNEYVTADATSSLPLTTGTVAATVAPDAATTMANGALVNVGGTIYVYAGGVAFGIPTPAVFNTISASEGNPAVVAASSVNASGAVRPGTLVQVAGSPQINVVGAGNTYAGFSTASQFLSDGYIAGDVIEIPNFGSLTATAGAPATAAATAANGALVNVGGTIYVYAGGVAFGIPTPAVFNTISASEGNPAVIAASSVNTTGTIATGTLVQVVGSPQINVVTSTGTQVGFSTVPQFTGDGYVPSSVIMIP